MKAAFWRFAHQLYHGRRLSALNEAAAFTWCAFWALAYGVALLAGWLPDVAGGLVALLLVGSPLTFGLLHRRIRIEAAKAPDALYRKRLCANR